MNEQPFDRVDEAAHLRPVSPEELGDLLVEYGLARVGDRLRALLWPSLRLRPAAGAPVAIGGSRLGGAPDLPPDTPWPTGEEARPLAFVAQLALASLGPLDPSGQLPEEGLLSFFYDAEEQPWGDRPEDAGGWHVRLSAADAQLAPREPPEALPAEQRFEPVALEAAVAWTLPPSDSLLLGGLGLSEDEAEGYGELLEEFQERAGAGVLSACHRVLGHPDAVQGDVMANAALPLGEAAEDWRLLLQVGSGTAGMHWGDFGRLYFAVRYQDLEARDFSGVWTVLQSG